MSRPKRSSAERARSEGRGETPASWTVEVWEDSHGHSPFQSWFDNLADYDQAVVLACMEHIVKPLGMDVCATEWGKPLGHGLYEIRVRRSLHAVRTTGEPDADPPDDPKDSKTVLLRIFATFHGSKVVLLFQGYDKGKDPSEKRQRLEIARARTHLKEWRAEQENAAKKHDVQAEDKQRKQRRR